jgi:hypothetical protein
MSGIVDNSLVGLALILSAGYAVSALGPRTWRRRLLAFLGRVAARAPAFTGVRRMAQRLAAASETKGGACGGCESCGSEDAGAQKPPAAEVRVPVAKIGRRG